MPVDTKNTVVLIFFIVNLNKQYMDFPKKDKNERKLNQQSRAAKINDYYAMNNSI